MRRPRGIRGRLFTAVLAGITLALAVMIAVFNLFLASSLSRNATDQARTRAAAQLELLHVTAAGVSHSESPDEAAPDVPVWVFSGRRAIEAPPASPRLSAAVRSLAESQASTAEVVDFRLAKLPLRADGRQVGAIVAAVSLGPYERTQHIALISSLVLGAVVLAAVGLALRWLLAAALRPVARMTDQAATWSEHGVEGRFEAGEPHDELTRLAGTLDTLLDRVAASLRHEQRFSAELSHELRTPLARIAAEAELALRRERTGPEYRRALELIVRSVDQLTRTVDAFVKAARHEAGLSRGTSDAHEAALRAIDACSAVADDRQLSIRLDPPAAPVRLGVDEDVAARILQPLIENACRHGRTDVRMAIRRSGSRVLFVVDDDGPGVRPEELALIFEPGVRGSAAVDDDGAGLGLALARRLARAVSGDVTAEATEGGRFTVTLPSA